MHALFAHAYHLARFGLHVLLLPIWRPPAAALAVALAGRAAGFARDPHCAGLTAGVAVLAGWLLLNPDWAAWPPPPVARLPGLALLLMLDVWPGGRTRQGRLVTAVIAALAAWWLRGAPGSLPGLAGCVPVAVGLAVALPLARWLARGDAGWGSVAAALVLAGGLMLTGASAHWARAALVPGLAALVLLGVPGAAGALADCIVVVAASALVASDRGRVLPIDVACLVPLAVVALGRKAGGFARLPPGPAALDRIL